jgi:XTP/dITP diphosphohydrolase
MNDSQAIPTLKVPTQKVIVATHNPGKLEELQAYLHVLPWQLALMPSDIEIEETGTTFSENACLKARTAAQRCGEWAIADDSGLGVAALGGAPGIYSARYGANDSARIQRLLNELADTPNRQAEFFCVLALANPQGEIVAQATGICPGEILTAPRGQGGFGYDPVFYVPELQLSYAEMSAMQKHDISHRGRAFQALLPQLGPLGLG